MQTMIIDQNTSSDNDYFILLLFYSYNRTIESSKDHFDIYINIATTTTTKTTITNDMNFIDIFSKTAILT